MTKRTESTPVVLGMHADDILNVFVRDGNELHQAARIMTVNGVDPSAMTAVMADLADTFGWRNIAAATSGVVPPPEELSPKTGVAPAAPVEAEHLALPSTPVKPEASSKADLRRRPRRNRADMKLQRDTIVKLLTGVPKDGAWPTSAVIARVAKVLKIKLSMSESTVRSQLTQLADAGVIGRQAQMMNNGYEGFKWYGL